jgi:hypothetical protein
MRPPDRTCSKAWTPSYGPVSSRPRRRASPTPQVSRVDEETGTAPRNHVVSKPMTRPDRCACLLIIPRCSGCPAAGRARCAGTRPVPVLTWLVAFWVCRWLRGTQAHPATPTAGVRLRRLPDHPARSWEQPHTRRVSGCASRASGRHLHHQGALRRPDRWAQPSGRRKQGLKRSVATEAGGIPLATCRPRPTTATMGC